MINGSTVVSHTETYGINVQGTSAFGVGGNWALQPGISVYSKGTPLGSWLPQIAGNFDNYDIQSLKFNYRAACSTLQPGLVMFAFEPNPEGSVPSSYQELRNMRSVDGSAHANLEFDLGGKLKKGLLIRKGPVVNLPSYDAGRVYFATTGCEDLAKLGFIDVTYVVRLYNPQSSLSTISPSITYQAAMPKYRSSFFPTGDSTVDVAAVSFSAFDNIHGGPKSGATDMFTSSNATVLATDLTFAGGCKFKHPAGSVNFLTAKFSGRYRIKSCYNMDFKDLFLFASVPYRLQVGSSTPEPAMEQVMDSMTGASVGELICLPQAHRGFSGTAVSDPNPGTDMPLIGEWDVLLNAGDRLTVAIGIRTYNNVSVTSATAIYRSGLGPSYIDIEFLGPT